MAVPAGIAKQTVVVRPLARADAGQAREVLVRAFADDPFMTWAFPRANRRRDQVATAFRGLIGHSMRHHGAFGAYAGERLLGAMVTFPHTAFPMSLREKVRSALDYLPLVARDPRALVRLVRANTAVERHHPAAPHAYLHSVGVDPAAQGMGVGSALIRHALGTADEARMPVFLETSNPKNVPLYEHLGFRTIETFAPAGAREPLRNWNMWRDAPAG